MSDTIFLRVGTQDRISLNTFIESLKNFLAVLKDLDAAVSHDSQGSMIWDVVSLEKNSPPVVGVAPYLKQGRADISAFVESQLITNAHLLSSKGERTEYMSDTGLKRFEKLAEQAKRQGTMEIYINGNGSVKAKADITEQTLTGVRQLTGVKYSAYGSAFGNLDAISIHNGNEFRVWDERTNKPIRCKFQDDELDRVKVYLGERVMVAGVVQSNAAGQPISMIVRELEFRGERTLPSVEEMSGFIKDFTEGKSLKEYMEELSNE